MRWLEGVMRSCMTLLKPGAHGLVWALPRTSHWTATALENAGFEIRDVVTHHFGTGFPKSLDVSKAIDKAAGVEREVVGVDQARAARLVNQLGDYTTEAGWSAGNRTAEITAPATDAAKEWVGWGTALKPASEHWILVRKPLVGTVAANVQEHGTGALNIDASRISAPGGLTTGGNVKGNSVLPMNAASGVPEVRPRSEEHVAGRFPANLILSHGEGCAEACAPRVPDRGTGRAERDKQERRWTYRQGRNVRDLRLCQWSTRERRHRRRLALLLLRQALNPRAERRARRG